MAVRIVQQCDGCGRERELYDDSLDNQTSYDWNIVNHAFYPGSTFCNDCTLSMLTWVFGGVAERPTREAKS